MQIVVLLLEAFERRGAGVGGDTSVAEFGVQLSQFGDDSGVRVADVLGGVECVLDRAVRLGQRRAEGGDGEAGLRTGLRQQA